jgi:hypothetical protein
MIIGPPPKFHGTRDILLNRVFFTTGGGEAGTSGATLSISQVLRSPIEPKQPLR